MLVVALMQCISVMFIVLCYDYVSDVFSYYVDVGFGDVLVLVVTLV